MPKKKTIRKEDIPNTLPEEFIKSHNYVKTGLLNSKINLLAISKKTPIFSTKSPDHFRSIVTRYVLLTPNKKKIEKIALSSYESGKLVITGSRDEEQVLASLCMTLHNLRMNANSDIKVNNYSLKNIVSTITLPVKIDLDLLYEKNREICTYTPTNFPGLSMRLPEKFKGTVNIFNTGKIVLPGPKSKKLSLDRLEWIYQKLIPYMIV